MNEEIHLKIYVDIRWDAPNEIGPIKARGLLNNRSWTFYTSGFRNTYWFEASTSWTKTIDMIGHGDPEYYCLTNESDPFDQTLTKDQCSEIIKGCCQKFALHLLEVQKGKQ